MSELEHKRQQLAALAAHLDGQRDAILARWREAAEREPRLSVALSLTQLQFQDHVPSVLDVLGNKLRIWPRAESAETLRNEKEAVTGHGLQRWQQGYQLPELTREWGYLQLCVADALTSYAAQVSMDMDAMSVAQRILTKLCWDGISDSTAQYCRLQQAEAAGHERDLKQALSTLHDLDQARAEFWREAAHDLRGSVTVVTGATSALELKNLPDRTRDKFFGMLQTGVSSLHIMLNDLVSLARLEAGHEQRTITGFDASTLLADFCRASVPLAQAKNLYLKCRGPEVLPVEGDRVKIHRILQNLVLNALKYTTDGGVTVVWEAGTGANAKNWMFWVQDTGPGLDAGRSTPLAQQIYEATQSSHEAEDANAEDSGLSQIDDAPTLPTRSRSRSWRQSPGEGVGLSIVKRLCELLDATLELETDTGDGCTFRVMIPRRYDDASDTGTDA
jgi:K+-sensing histidine kinase KdpD